MKNLTSLAVALSVLGFTTATAVFAHEGEDHGAPGQSPQQGEHGDQGKGQDQHKDGDQHKHHKQKDHNKNPKQNDGHSHQH